MPPSTIVGVWHHVFGLYVGPAVVRYTTPIAHDAISPLSDGLTVGTDVYHASGHCRKGKVEVIARSRRFCA